MIARAFRLPKSRKTSEVLLALTLAVLASPASAQDIDGAIVVEGPKVILTEAHFKQLLFGNPNGTVPQQNPESALENELAEIDRSCVLSADQKKKLRLAGRGDIKRLFERVRELQEQTGRPLTIAERNALFRELQVLGLRLRGEFLDDESLLRKTLRNALTDEQLARYAALERRRRLTAVESVLQSWEQRAIGVKLPDDKRKQLAELLIDKPHSPKLCGSYTHYIVLLQIGDHEAEVRALLGEAQWEPVARQLVSARRAEPQLRQMGVWPPADATNDDEAKE